MQSKKHIYIDSELAILQYCKLNTLNTLERIISKVSIVDSQTLIENIVFGNYYDEKFEEILFSKLSQDSEYKGTKEDLNLVINDEIQEQIIVNPNLDKFLEYTLSQGIQTTFFLLKSNSIGSKILEYSFVNAPALSSLNIEVLSYDMAVQSFQNKDNLIILTHQLSKFAEIQFSGKRILFQSFTMDPQEIVAQKILSWKELSITNIYQLMGLVNIFELNLSNEDFDSIPKMGYFLDTKKENDLIMKETLISSKELIYFPIDFRIPEKNRKINGLLHKIITPLKDANFSVNEAIMKNFNDYFSSNPNIIPFSNVTMLPIMQDRLKCQDFFNEIFDETEEFSKDIELNFPGMKVKAPHACTFYNDTKDKENSKEKLQQLSKSMNFPIIIKPFEACTSAISHTLSVALNKNGILKVLDESEYSCKDLLFQELINHEETVYKVYVIGDYFETHKRPSIPNLTIQSLQSDYIKFNSQKSFCSQLPIKNGEIRKEDIDLILLKKLVNRISQKSKLNIYGFDIVANKEFNIFYLIDINYFPGFKETKDFSSILQSLFLSEIKK